MLKFNDLSGKAACPTRRKVADINLTGEMMNPGIVLAKLAKEVVKKVLVNKTMTEAEIPDFLRDGLSEVTYYLEYQKEKDIEEVTKALKQFIHYTSEWIAKLEKPIVKEAVKSVVEIAGNDVEVAPTFTVETDKVVYVILFSYKRKNVSESGRGDDTSIYRNSQAYAMLLYGEKYFAGKTSVPMFAFMRATNSRDDHPTSLRDFEKHFLAVATKLISLSARLKAPTLIMKGYEEAFESLVDGRPCSKSACERCELKHICNFVKPPVSIKKEEVKKKSHLFSLSKEQKQVIAFDDGVMRVNAGAGAGKTLVTAMNIIERLLEGEDPEKILLITFTDNGAKEMRTRLFEYGESYDIPKEDILKVVVTTFNGFGQMMLDRYWKELGYSEKPVLLSPVDSYDLLLEIVKNRPQLKGFDYRYPLMNKPNYKGVVPALLDIYETNRGKKMREYVLPEGIDVEEVFSVMSEYTEKMKANSLIDFGNQDDAVFEALEADPYLFTYDFPYEHIIVDEFQDSNDKQLEIVRLMTGGAYFRSLIVVGDDSQSIFGFRGTTPYNIIHFDEIIGLPVTDVNLVENYRSTPEIIGLANALNAQMWERVDKDLISMRDPGKKPELVYFKTAKDEIAGVANRIKKMVDDGANLSSICFIARTRAELRKMQTALTERGIVSRLDVAEPIDTSSRVLAAYDLAEFFSSNSSGALLSYLNCVLDNQTLSMPKVKEFLEHNLKDYKRLSENLTMNQMKKLFFDLLALLDDGDSFYSAFLSKVKERKGKDINDILDYILKLRDYEVSDSARRDEYVESVCLSTIHSSKGLEWDHVFFSTAGFTRSDGHDEDLRLLFVAVTRARDTIFITDSQESTANAYMYVNGCGSSVITATWL